MRKSQIKERKHRRGKQGCETALQRHHERKCVDSCDCAEVRKRNGW